MPAVPDGREGEPPGRLAAQAAGGEMIGEPDAGKPHVRFDEGVQETYDTVTRLHPTLPEPPFAQSSSSFFVGGPVMPSTVWPGFGNRGSDAIVHGCRRGTSCRSRLAPPAPSCSRAGTPPHASASATAFQ